MNVKNKMQTWEMKISLKPKKDNKGIYAKSGLEVKINQVTCLDCTQKK